MPTPTRILTIDDVREYVRQSCIRPTPDKRVGLEVEWLAIHPADPVVHVPFELVERVATGAGRPSGTRLTFEPGGQIELSSPPLLDVAHAIDAVAGDAAELALALDKHAIALHGNGMDHRPIRRVRDNPRYRAMESFFDLGGPAGRRMMAATAAIQVNLDLGTTETLEHRWMLAHTIGPTLAALFANSPADGAAQPWRSARMANWFAIDPTRTAPVANGASCADAWTDYALRANLMLIRRSADDFVPMRSRLPFERWVAEGHDLGWPTLEDVEYHLTTLFPPIRLRGWIEIRVLDALPDPWWPVAAAVTAALLDDDEAADTAARACAPVADRWRLAFRDGLTDPPLGVAARACFEAALEAMPRLRVDAKTIADAGRYFERYVARGRSPADDRLDAADDRLALEAT